MKENRYNELLSELKKYDSLAVAYSGGADSTLLIKAAKDALNDKAVAVTIKSEFVPANEFDEAKSIASEIGIKHIVIPFHPLDYPDIRKNPKDRCYHCKQGILSAILEKTEELGIKTVAEGSNADDVTDIRPGFRAVQEYGVASPYLSVNFTKQEIREISKTLGLRTWNKPAAACLASRIAYGDIITKESLEKVEKTEMILSSLGFSCARARLHKNLARIEILPEDFDIFFTKRERIVYSLKDVGFTYIALDLQGYRRGSMNET